jgi:hypothetical protein
MATWLRHNPKNYYYCTTQLVLLLAECCVVTDVACSLLRSLRILGSAPGITWKIAVEKKKRLLWTTRPSLRWPGVRVGRRQAGTCAE